MQQTLKMNWQKTSPLLVRLTCAGDTGLFHLVEVFAGYVFAFVLDRPVKLPRNTES